MNFSGQVVIEREFERVVIWRRNTSNVLFLHHFFVLVLEGGKCHYASIAMK